MKSLIFLVVLSVVLISSVSATTIATFRNGTLIGYTNSDKTFEELKAIKEVNGAISYEISKVNYDKLINDWTASDSGGEISVTKPLDWKGEAEKKADKEAKELDKLKSKLQKLGVVVP